LYFRYETVNKRTVSYHAAGVAHPGQPGGDALPHSDAALSDGLPGCQLQEEQGDAHHQHEQHIQEQERS